MLSIVIPVYNTPESQIERCVASICSQSFRDLEIILCDDGSGPAAADCLDRLKERDPRIRVFHQENGGPSSARNRGMKEARGEFLGFADSDDSLDPEACERSLALLEESGADAVVFGIRKLYPDGRVEEIPAAAGDPGGTLREAGSLVGEIIRDDLSSGGGYPVNKIWDLRKTGTPELFDEELFSYEDKLWCVQMYLRCKKVLLLPEIYYSYYQTEGSISRNPAAAARKRENALLAYEKIAALLPEGSAERRAAEQVRRRIRLHGFLKRLAGLEKRGK